MESVISPHRPQEALRAEGALAALALTAAYLELGFAALCPQEALRAEGALTALALTAHVGTFTLAHFARRRRCARRARWRRWR